MIAIALHSWYTEAVKQSVAVLCGIIIVLGLFFVGFFEPGLLISLPLLSKLAWSLIDKIGLLNQRRINTHWNLRQKIERIYSVNLIAVTMLEIAAQIPDSSTDNPELFFRRRFMPLPA